MKYRKLFVLSLIYGFLSACATTDYVTHYGIFTAENSAGEFRQFRVYWQTLRYEGWTSNEYRAMPVVLEAQCSKRKVNLFDASFGKGRRCKGQESEGIFYCGRSQVDMDRRGLEIENNSLCASITDRSGATDILSLEGDVLLTVSCRPKKTQSKIHDKKVNVDYLLNSRVPYVVATKKIKGGNIDALVPPLFNHSSVCDPDD
jgi:hypothetical protein